MTSSLHPDAHRWRRFAGGVLLVLVLVELGIRVATGSLFTLHSPDDREAHRVLDPVVGYVPRPGLSLRPRKGGFTISTGENGTRSNGAHPVPPPHPATLVVGDSFAFGDEVDDAESWPAVLERATGRRVINAAVPGFGLDQAVLRAERLMPVYSPDVVLVSFIPHDVLRCAMSWWSGNAKPHFDVDGARLVLRPPPPPERSAPERLLVSALSLSATVDYLFPKWLHWGAPDRVEHDRGPQVACLLTERLLALAGATGAKVVLVAQPQRSASTDEERALKDGVMACAKERGLSAIDLFPAVERATVEKGELFRGHMTAEGNRVIAAEVRGYLERRPP